MTLRHEDHADSSTAREPRDEATFKQHAPSPDNRRKSVRYGVELDVTLASDHNFYGGFAENLSVGGVFIATHTKKPVGELMEFSITLPGVDEPIRGLGEVRWVREYSERSNVPPGLGLRFVRLSRGAPELIERFLRGREPLFYDES